MANRIEKWWEEIKAWKRKFENLLNSKGQKPDRNLLKEELRRYDVLLSKRLKNMTAEERFTRRQVVAERKKLMKQLYPNVVVRFMQNVGGLLSATAKLALPKRKDDQVSKQEKEQLERFKLSGMRQPNSPNYKPSYSESLHKNEVLDYKLRFKELANGQPVLYGYEVSTKDAQGSEKKMFIPEDMGINKYQARELLNGRAVNVKGDTWIVPDLNDRDAKGNIKIREINIPDFKIKDQLLAIPGVDWAKNKLEKVYDELIAGKQSHITITREKSQSNISIEVDPIKREFKYYQNGQRVKPEQLSGTKPVKKNNVVDLHQKRNRKLKPNKL